MRKLKKTKYIYIYIVLRTERGKEKIPPTSSSSAFVCLSRYLTKSYISSYGYGLPLVLVWANNKKEGIK